MATTKAISGNVQKNNGGTVLHGGNIDGTNLTNNLTLTENSHHPEYGAKVILANGSAIESGNIGTQKALSSGNFAKLVEGEYIIRRQSTKIAGATNNLLLSGASDTSSRRSLHYAKGNHRYDNSSWDYVTGVLTKGANAGVLFEYFDPAAGASIAQEPYPTNAVPGELVYMHKGTLATQDDYKARTNP